MGALVLTILLAIVWVGFAGLGYWQGGWRQVVFLAGMLLSYAVLSEWAVPNGHDLATQFHWRLARTTTGVALLYLLGGTVILGFLGGFVLSRPRPLGARERQLGAAMGILDGGLLLALVLRTLQSYAYGAGGGRLLRTTAFARFFIDSIGYVLLVALIFGLVAVALGLALAQRGEKEAAPDVEHLAAEAIAMRQQSPYEEPRPWPAASPAPPESPARPPVREPVYMAEPIIDWPTAPPPGTPVEPVAVAASAAPPAPEQSSLLPPQPVLPHRVPPPMRYPVAELIAAHSTLAPGAPPLPAGAIPPPAGNTPPPVSTSELTAPPLVVTPPTVARPPQPPAPDVPTVDPASLPVAPPDTVPPVVRELDIATQDVAPVVRELDMATQDVPLIAPAQTAPAIEAPPAPPEAPSDAAIGEEGTPRTVEPTPSLPTVTPSAVNDTAPIPLATVVPPPLPPVPIPTVDAAPIPDAEESQEAAARPRTGFARVAVARQAGARADQSSAQSPAPQPPPESEPLQPPLPTGPRVHACPTCGYPVRDHARYCPNCGSRQRL